MVGEQLSRRATIQERLTSLGELTEEIPDDFAAQPGDAPAVSALKAELAILVAAYHRGWQAVESMGAVVKDPQVGLVDFYGQLDGNLVWLCWKYGEAAVMARCNCPREVVHAPPATAARWRHATASGLRFAGISKFSALANSSSARGKSLRRYINIPR